MNTHEFPRFSRGKPKVCRLLTLFIILESFLALFLSTYVNKVDRKGRVSLPAPFRAALGAEAEQGIVLFRSSTHLCLEGFSYGLVQDVSARLDQFDLFSADQDDLATTIFGEAVQVPIDGDGRIILPADLISHVAIADQAAFVGMGRKFQIWNPSAYDIRKEEARKSVKAKGLSLPKVVSND